MSATDPSTETPTTLLSGPGANGAGSGTHSSSDPIPDPILDPIKEAQDIVRTLRRAAQERAAAEQNNAEQLTASEQAAAAERQSGEAEARRRRERAEQEATAVATRARSEAQDTAARRLAHIDGQINAVRTSLLAGTEPLNQPEIALAEGVAEIRRDARNAGHENVRSAEAPQVLHESVERAQATANNVRATAVAILRAREARRAARTRAITMTVVAALVLACLAAYGYFWWQLESAYRGASDLLAAGQWSEARAGFAKLAPAKGVISGVYRDSDVKLRETYYGSAVALLEAKQWPQARAELHSLLAQDPQFRDAPTLLRESYYRPAQAAFQANQWQAARVELAELGKLDPAYRDAPALLRESYYRPGTAALEAGRWDEARAEIGPLLAIDHNYKDAPTLLRESHYRPAVAALDGQRWDEARTLLQELMNVDGTYKDAPVLLRESYYRPATAALDGQRWDDARNDLKELLAVDGNYKDASALFREAYYRPGQAAFDAGDLNAARDHLSVLVAFDAGYRDARALLMETYFQQMQGAASRSAWDEAATAMIGLEKLDRSYKGAASQLLTQPELYEAVRRGYGAIWQQRQLAQMRVCQTHASNVVGFGSTANGTIAVRNRDGVITVMDPTTCRVVTSFDAGAVDWEISDDARTIATVSGADVISLWNGETGKALPIAPQFSSPIKGSSIVGFSDQGRIVRIMGFGLITSYSTQSGQRGAEYKLPSGLRTWVIRGANVLLKVADSWSYVNLDNGYEKRLAFREQVDRMIVTRDGQRTIHAVCKPQGLDFKVTAIMSAEQMQVLALSEACTTLDDLQMMRMHWDDQRLVTIFKGKLTLWSTNNGRMLSQQQVTSGFSTANISADGRYLLIGRGDGSVEIWEAS